MGMRFQHRPDLRKAIAKGRYWIREMDGVIQLKKYRVMKERYGATATTELSHRLKAMEHNHDDRNWEGARNLPHRHYSQRTPCCRSCCNTYSQVGTCELMESYILHLQYRGMWSSWKSELKTCCTTNTLGEDYDDGANQYPPILQLLRNSSFSRDVIWWDIQNQQIVVPEIPSETIESYEIDIFNLVEWVMITKVQSILFVTLRPLSMWFRVLLLFALVLQLANAFPASVCHTPHDNYHTSCII